MQERYTRYSKLHNHFTCVQHDSFLAARHNEVDEHTQTHAFLSIGSPVRDNTQSETRNDHVVAGVREQVEYTDLLTA